MRWSILCLLFLSIAIVMVAIAIYIPDMSLIWAMVVLGVLGLCVFVLIAIGFGIDWMFKIQERFQQKEFRHLSYHFACVCDWIGVFGASLGFGSAMIVYFYAFLEIIPNKRLFG